MSPARGHAEPLRVGLPPELDRRLARGVEVLAHRTRAVHGGLPRQGAEIHGGRGRGRRRGRRRAARRGGRNRGRRRCRWWDAPARRDRVEDRRREADEELVEDLCQCILDRRRRREFRRRLLEVVTDVSGRLRSSVEDELHQLRLVHEQRVGLVNDEGLPGRLRRLHVVDVVLELVLGRLRVVWAWVHVDRREALDVRDVDRPKPTCPSREQPHGEEMRCRRCPASLASSSSSTHGAIGTGVRFPVPS